MKKILVMLLVASMCVFLAACGGADNSTNTSGDETENDYAKIISDTNNYWADSQRLSNISITFCEDNTYRNGATGEELGTWEINDTTLTITSEDGNSTYYEIKEINGMCVLIDNNDILYNVTLDKSEFPIKEVEITIDNWQEYFEIATLSVENVDIFGEVTETSECYLKLKDEYYKYFINSCGDIRSEIALRYKSSSSDYSNNDGYMDIWNNASVFGKHWGEEYELVKIQGTLYFWDIE